MSSSFYMSTPWDSLSTNIVNFQNLTVSSYISVGNYVILTSNNGDIVSAYVTDVNSSANTISLSSNVWLTLNNVASGNISFGNNFIKISSISSTYDVINNNIYANQNTIISDIIRVGDLILIDNFVKSVVDVNNSTQIITTDTPYENTTSSIVSVNRTFNGIGANAHIFTLGPDASLSSENGFDVVSENNILLII